MLTAPLPEPELPLFQQPTLLLADCCFYCFYNKRYCIVTAGAIAKAPAVSATIIAAK